MPVDTVSNHVIMASAYMHLRPNQMEIFNCGTSHQKPLLLNEYRDYMVQSLKYKGFDKNPGVSVYIDFIKDPKEYAMRSFIYEQLPIKIMELASQMPIIGSKQAQA